MTTGTVWVPPSALASMIEELAQLAAHPRPDAVTAGRIRELRKTLRHSEAEIKPDDGLVEPGMRVTAMLSGDTRATVFLLGERELASLDPGVDIDVYSPSSPVGRAIIGSFVGDTVTYATPSNPSVRIEILAAVPYTG
ncbi:transcription elongation factor GreA [Cryobacterium sp. MP_M5]|uniref:GreA/GreB family elongation factor n=1 Tax=unclassified Cryobacterium TaxID=2649013 RepID=UPI0018CA84F9|nr:MULTISPECIES: GreA/GreB family elongation factor [unclassified Cryobacterium]MBG6059413.1 transcription elongation factor GreA [Cryobacterium sp. MP_M3]MEC5177608.1 transcription elongation factor GreA [Cryobacterium sp. MP_M5]